MPLLKILYRCSPAWEPGLSSYVERDINGRYSTTHELFSVGGSRSGMRMRELQTYRVIP